MMLLFRTMSFWIRLEKILTHFNFEKQVSKPTTGRYSLDHQGDVPASFRIILFGLACVISALLFLRVMHAAIDQSHYSTALQVALDFTLAIATPLCAVYLHWILKNRIRRQVQEYKTLFKENPHAMWLYDVKTLKFLMVNDAAVALYGYTTEEFLAMNVSDIRLPEDMPAMLDEEDTAEASSLGQYHWSGIWRHKTKGNREIYAEVSSYRMLFNGKPAALALSYDVTEKVQQELKLVTLNQELEEKVKERTNDLLVSNHTLVQQNSAIRKANQQLAKVTEELKVANEKLKQHTEFKSQFVSMVSHEFRSPLSSIRFATEFLNRNHSRLSKKQMLDRTKCISKTIDHMEALLTDVLVIQRCESPRIQASFEEVDIQAFISSVTHEVLQATKFTNEILITTESLPERINSDQKLLRNIFLNLLGNAVKYSEPGKVVKLSLRCSQSNIYFDVVDQGMGIDAAYMNKIFEPFYRTPEVNNIQGTGLGLSIVKRAVEGMGGEITLESTVGKGSTFSVRLPLNESNAIISRQTKSQNI